MACNTRHGLSLIEVVASIALLSTLMVAMLSAWTRHRNQIEQSQKKLQAVVLLDEQLASWFVNGSGPPFPSEGQLAGSPFVWRTFRTPQGRPIPGGLVPVTVQVLDRNNQPVTSVEVAGIVRIRPRTPQRQDPELRRPDRGFNANE